MKRCICFIIITHRSAEAAYKNKHENVCVEADSDQHLGNDDGLLEQDYQDYLDYQDFTDERIARDSSSVPAGSNTVFYDQDVFDIAGDGVKDESSDESVQDLDDEYDDPVSDNKEGDDEDVSDDMADNKPTGEEQETIEQNEAVKGEGSPGQDVIGDTEGTHNSKCLHFEATYNVNSGGQSIFCLYLLSYEKTFFAKFDTKWRN